MSTVPTPVETHVSRVFFTEERAYKLLKPVALSFLDLTDRDRRLTAARRELELNRRIAPDVYLGLGDLHENGELVDHLIIMRRMPDDRRLSRVLEDGNADDCLRRVAWTVAAFHAGLEPLTDDDAIATPEATRERWDDNLATVAESVGTIIEREAHDRVAQLAHRYLDANPALFVSRIADGFVRDGHGDLIADDIFCLEDGPRILDCLAFRDDFRIGDVLSDIAFLVMDVHRLAGPGTARRLMGWYQEYSNEHHPASLAHNYVAYRAHVRAKVACLAHGQGRTDQAELARAYHALALHHLELSRGRLILIGGAPGVGKSTVAESLGRTFNMPILVTDALRKDLAGIARDDHRAADIGAGLYSPEMTTRVYDELLRQAELLMTSGESVILDASWSSDDHRCSARRLAERHGAELVEIECTLDPAEAKQRIDARRARGDDPSDATVATFDELAARRDPWPGSHRISTAGPVHDVCSRLRILLDAPSTPPRRSDSTSESG